MKKALQISIPLFLLLSLASSVLAQQPQRGSIRGAVYEDVDGDGKCIGTGVEGEGPVVGINVEFVSSDEATVVTLQTGDDGTYGLVAAGFSYWGVTVKPDENWVVTSEETIYVPVFEDSPLQTDVNFCIQNVKNVKTILPVSGGAASTMGWITVVIGLIGISLITIGLGMEWWRRQSA